MKLKHSKKYTNYVLGVMILVLVFIAVFCYDLGSSANTILPGRGDGLISISAASGAFVVLTAVNLVLLQKKK